MNDDEVMRHLVAGAKGAGARDAHEVVAMLERQGLIARVEASPTDPPRWVATSRARRFIEYAHRKEVGVA